MLHPPPHNPAFKEAQNEYRNDQYQTTGATANVTTTTPNLSFSFFYLFCHRKGTSGPQTVLITSQQRLEVRRAGGQAKCSPGPTLSCATPQEPKRTGPTLSWHPEEAHLCARSLGAGAPISQPANALDVAPLQLYTSAPIHSFIHPHKDSPAISKLITTTTSHHHPQSVSLAAMTSIALAAEERGKYDHT